MKKIVLSMLLLTVLVVGCDKKFLGIGPSDPGEIIQSTNFSCAEFAFGILTCRAEVVGGDQPLTYRWGSLITGDQVVEGNASVDLDFQGFCIGMVAPEEVEISLVVIDDRGEMVGPLKRQEPVCSP